MRACARRDRAPALEAATLEAGRPRAARVDGSVAVLAAWAGIVSAPPMLESELRRVILCDRKGYPHDVTGALVTGCPGDCLAHLLGWHGMYATPLRTKHGWATPTRGSLGAGWPDLVLARGRPGRTGRVLAVELKGTGGTVAAEQYAVLDVLAAAGLEVYIWYPQDFDEGTVQAVLMADERPPSEPTTTPAAHMTLGDLDR